MATTTTNSTERRIFTASDVGLYATKNGDSLAYAFLLEGFVTRDPVLYQASAEKKAFAGTSIGLGTGMNAFAMYARAMGVYSKDEEYPETDFVSVRVFDKLAESFSADVRKGMKVVLCGVLKKEAFTRKDGTEGEEICINVDNYIPLPRDGGALSTRFSYGTKTFTTGAGTTGTTSCLMLMSGEIKYSPDLKTDKNGKSYLHVAVTTLRSSKRAYDLANGSFNAEQEYDNNSNQLTLTFFGARAESYAKLLRKGMLIAFSGNVKADDYNGNVTYKVFPAAISVISYGDETAPAASGSGKPAKKAATKSTAKPAATNATAAGEPDFPDVGEFSMDGDDDDVPF